MRAYLTSIGEPTTELAQWALERNGFEVVLLENQDPLHIKLGWIYEHAQDDFVRVDADVIVNRFLTPDLPKPNWWMQYQTFDMYKLTPVWGGVQYITRDAIPFLRQGIKALKHPERPETEMFRLEAFHNPRRCDSIPEIMGLHGFGQKNLDRVIKTKVARNQFDDYDWQMAQRLEAFYA